MTDLARVPGEARAPGAGVLVVGYGSTLRGDDGAGPRAAELAAVDPRLAGATVLVRHQLTPEIADAMRAASLVVLVDADAGVPAGSIRVLPVDPAVPGAPTAGASSHHVDAAGLAALAGELWGARPVVVSVGIGATAFELDDALSPAVERALPAAVDAVAALAEEHRGA